MSLGLASTRPPSRRRLVLARALQVVSVLGAVVALLVAVIGFRVVGAVDETVVESAEVAADALTSLADTLVVAEGLVESVDQTLAALEDGLTTTTATLTDGTAALDSVATLATDAAPALDSATATLRSLERVGATIDTTLQGLSQLPFGPSYDPEQSFGATVSQLADDLEPLSESFATTAEDLDAVAASSDQLEEDLQELTVAVGDAVDQLDDSATLIQDYRATADRAQSTADAAGQGLETDLDALRILLLVGGIVFAIGQVVPWLIARALLEVVEPSVESPVA